MYGAFLICKHYVAPGCGLKVHDCGWCSKSVVYMGKSFTSFDCGVTSLVLGVVFKGNGKHTVGVTLLTCALETNVQQVKYIVLPYILDLAVLPKRA